MGGDLVDVDPKGVGVVVVEIDVVLDELCVDNVDWVLCDEGEDEE